MRRHLWLWVAVGLLAGCVRRGPQDAGREPSVTGAVSEAEFKALHVLRTAAPPAPRGQELEVAGMKAYLSLPPGAKGPLPAVLVIHEWWGLNAHMRHWADRLAANGYAALAVDLYGGEVATTGDRALALLRAVDPARATQALRAAHAFLQEDPRIRAPRTGSLGWCFGGSWALRTAMAIPELDAAVLYYANPVVTDVEALAPIRASVLGIFAARDEVIPPEKPRALREALAAAGVRHRIVEFDGLHGFANPSNEDYVEASAAAAWAETSRFFESHLRP
ncbi:dienelactone hydrolase family protein [Myxococcus stipitatus]|uniref:dienelactone hydrolase family protein n=1 Tax=Myxococcus stipitatus TaxID=83455 RepID=UPI0031451D3A